MALTRAAADSLRISKFMLSAKHLFGTDVEGAEPAKFRPPSATTMQPESAAIEMSDGLLKPRPAGASIMTAVARSVPRSKAEARHRSWPQRRATSDRP